MRTAFTIACLFYSTILLAQYWGGEADGYSVRLATMLLNGQEQSLFNGGQGDGYSVQQANVLLKGEDLAQLFGGGDDDGFSTFSTNSLIDGSELSILYSGGEEDGFSEDTGNGLFLNGVLLSTYYGGEGDGFSKALTTDLLMGEMLSALFSGGVGDGFAQARLDGFFLDVLPVEWISFEAIKRESTVLLLWSTATETNNDRFEVERSADALNFTKINEIPGAGTTDLQQNYEDVDSNPLSGHNYYRIKQVDFDGNFSYTDIRSVLFEDANAGFNAKIYPNPSKERVLHLEVSGVSPNKTGTIDIYNTNGQLLMTQEITAAGQVKLDWRWPAGTYWMQIQVGDNQVAKAVVLVD